MKRYDSGSNMNGDTHPTRCKTVQVLIRTWALFKPSVVLRSDQLHHRILTVSSTLNTQFKFLYTLATLLNRTNITMGAKNMALNNRILRKNLNINTILYIILLWEQKLWHFK